MSQLFGFYGIIIVRGCLINVFGFLGDHIPLTLRSCELRLSNIGFKEFSYQVNAIQYVPMNRYSFY